MIHHFYHIYADGQWKEPVDEHLRALKMGLLNNLQTFAIGLVGSTENRSKVIEHLRDCRIPFTIAAESISGWEQVTQTAMWEFSQRNDGLMLYAHTKGASDQSEVNIRWRRSMTYWNVIRWQLAAEKLREVDAYGCHWIQPLVSMPEHRQGNFMFAGTFFWARCEVMRTWMQPPMNHRHEAEGWIGYGYAAAPWSVWDCTPYFPNQGPFADGWVTDENFVGEIKGVAIPPTETVNFINV